MAQFLSQSLEIYGIWQFVMDKYTNALACGITDSDERSQEFYLSSDQGIVRVIVYNTSEIRIIGDLPLFWSGQVTIDFGYDELTYYSDNPFDNPEEFVTGAAVLIVGMEIVPYPKIPYGLVYNNKVVGIIFTGEIIHRSTAYETNSRKKGRRALGGNIELYVINNLGVQAAFPFLNEADPVTWWRHFWDHYFGEDIVPLYDRFRQYPHLFTISAGQTGYRTWLHFDKHDSLPPYIPWNEHYWAWSPQRRGFSTQTPPVGGKTEKNLVGWFGYSVWLASL